MPCAELIYIDNTNVIELTELTNSVTSAAITNATVTVSLYDSAGVLVTSQSSPNQIFPLSMSHVAGGTYRAALIDGLVIVENRQYIAHIDANASGTIGHWELPVRAKVRT